ncbi:AAA family ATPase [Virgibacillus halodenitrificans]|nr:AAA family ATPase [Virgibacillus halodenitrificans]
MITDDIIKWVEKQPYWQKIIAKKLLEDSQITDEDLESIFNIFKIENKLIDETLEQKELDFSINRDATSKIPNIKWKGLSKVSSVNAIRDGESFPIGDKVTLVYGENGSGKSGYTRLLNNIFISRGDKNILPNLFSNNSELPRSKVIFEDENGSLEEISFPDDKDHPYNKRITVFDSHSAIHDLTKEAELSFSPIEFKFFDDFLLYIDIIKNKLGEEISAKKEQNYFIKYFDKETSVKQAVSKLNSETDIDQFKALIKVSEEDIKTNEKNTTRKAELLLMNIDSKKEEYQKLISDLENFKKRINILNQKFSSERLTKTKELIEERTHYKKVSSEEGLSQFKSEDIDNLGSTEWKEFIKAAKEYYQTINQEIDYCIFCQQDIRGIDLIDKYWKYLKSDAEKNLTTKNSEIEKIKNDFFEIDCSIVIKGSKIDEWIKGNQPDLHYELIYGENEFSKLREIVIQSLESHEWGNYINSYNFDAGKIDIAIEYFKAQISKLKSENIQNEIKQLQAAENEYIDKLKAEKLVPDIEEFILNSKWVKLAEKNKITTRSITSIQNQLFSKYVTDEYVRTFNEECKKLKAEFSAEIKQRGSKGTTLNSLTVKGKKPLEILSEGEQRSIALANFLAETSIHNNNFCIIFDDPVSSLDYKRRELIADRLIEEAKRKQVVILTHDLTFLLTLQKKCEEQRLDCLSTTIRKIQMTTGIIESSLPWIGMPVKKRLSHLKVNLQKLESQYRQISPNKPEGLKVYEDGAKLWCEELRETWERSIEEILFNNSVQRFSPAIQTQRLEKAPFTSELYTEVREGMKNCSNWVHDRASGLGEETPEPAILKGYLDDCERFIKTNRPK